MGRSYIRSFQKTPNVHHPNIDLRNYSIKITRMNVGLLSPHGMHADWRSVYWIGLIEK